MDRLLFKSFVAFSTHNNSAILCNHRQAYYYIC